MHIVADTCISAFDYMHLIIDQTYEKTSHRLIVWSPGIFADNECDTLAATQSLEAI